MTKQSHFFNDCLLTILKDFELCPYFISLKDCFVLYRLVTQGHVDFSLQHLTACLQVIAELYLPTAIDSPSKQDQEGLPDFADSNTRAVLLLKKIELSFGYEGYRKERLVQGTSKPPILLVSKQQLYQSSPSKRDSSRSPVKR